MWLRDYAATRSEFDPPDDLTVYSLTEALGLAMEKIVAASPADAVEVLGRLFENIPATEGSILSNITWAFAQKPNILKVTASVGTNVDARYALAAILLVQARCSAWPDEMLGSIAKRSGRTLDQQREHDEDKHVKNMGKLKTALHDLGLCTFDKYYPREALTTQVSLHLFGEPWAVLYAPSLDSYNSIIQAVLIERPPFVGSALLQSKPLPDHYST